MRLGAAQWAVVLSTATVLACGPQSPPPPTPSAGPQPSAATPAADGADAADENVPVPPVRSAATLQALLPSNAPRCAPTARCIRVTAAGLPQTNGNSIAQCRGEFADFIVPSTTLPAGYAGPWFQPNLIEAAHTGVPSGTRPWRSFDPRQESQRLQSPDRPAELRFCERPSAEPHALAHRRRRLLQSDWRQVLRAPNARRSGIPRRA